MYLQAKKVHQHTVACLEAAKGKHEQEMKRLQQHLQKLAISQAHAADNLPRPAGVEDPVIEYVSRDLQRMNVPGEHLLQPMVLVNQDANHEAFNERSALTAELVHQSTDRKERQLNFGLLIDKIIQPKSSAGVPNSVQALLCVGDRLWCLMYDKLHILNTKDNLQAVVTKTDLKGARGMTLTQHKDVIIATLDLGLLQFSTKGKLIKTIHDGRYHDVSFSQGTLYAVSKDKNNTVVIHPFKHKDQQWIRMPHIITEQVLQRGHLTMAVQADSIFVCSTGQNCLYRLGMSGYVQSQVLLGAESLQNITIQVS